MLSKTAIIEYELFSFISIYLKIYKILFQEFFFKFLKIKYIYIQIYTVN